MAQGAVKGGPKHYRVELENEQVRVKAGEVLSYPACEHLPENMSDHPLELVFFDCKDKA